MGPVRPGRECLVLGKGREERGNPQPPSPGLCIHHNPLGWREVRGQGAEALVPAGWDAGILSAQ